MPDREKVINGLEHCIRDGDCRGCPYFKEILDSKIICPCREDALTLLKEQKNEYENGFNDAMLGKQELMYEGTDGKWHKKDW